MVDRSITPLTAPIPTTPHRTVRFQLDAMADDWRREPSINNDQDGRVWPDQEDSMYSDNEFEDDSMGGRSGRAPLLTGMDAPAVRLSMDMDASAIREVVLESARPKSGMGMAFFNMS